jgi:hypothetical protein
LREAGFPPEACGNDDLRISCWVVTAKVVAIPGNDDLRISCFVVTPKVMAVRRNDISSRD